MHQDLVFDAAGGVGRKLDLLVRVEGADGLDQTDRSDRNEILHSDARTLKALCQKDDKPQIVLDQKLPCIRVSPAQSFDRLALCLTVKGLRHAVAAADVVDLRSREEPAPQASKR